jgi:hypothetical protein
MSIATARRTLSRAFAELAQANGDVEARRQAAEKGWRAAREAVYAVMQAAGVEVHGTVGASAVADFEAKYLGRPRGKSGGQPLASDYARAQLDLHGACFYGGVVPDNLQGEMEQVGALIELAAEDIKRVKPNGHTRGGKRRRK